VLDRPDPIIDISSDADGIKDTGAVSMWKRLIWFLAAVTFTVPGTASAQVTADVPPFTADEIAIYRDFLLHYPEQPSEMIGMRDYTLRFVEAYAFGEEPNPPKLNLDTPPYSARQLPPEVMELTTEDAVTTRAAAEHKPIYPELRNRLKLSEIPFDSKHEHAAFVYSSMQGRGGTSGTVVYQRKNGQWERKAILNFRIA
jgi:hypothetical protein